MPSLSDIPDHLLSQDAAPAFNKWVTNLPVDRHTMKAIARIWCKVTDTRLTAKEWARLEAQMTPR
jgi:hypothetical protein